MRLLAFLLLFIFAVSPVSAADNLYQRLGEKPGVAQIADRMLAYALADDRIKSTFANANLPRLKTLLTLHFCVVTGGPCTYPGRSMEEAHKGLGIRDMHFNALVENLQLAMDDIGIGSATQNEFLARLAPMHRDVVKR